MAAQQQDLNCPFCQMKIGARWIADGNIPLSDAQTAHNESLGRSLSNHARTCEKNPSNIAST